MRNPRVTHLCSLDPVNQTSKAFQEYQWFSVQVDQHYATAKIFARHYEGLKAAYAQLPQESDWPKDLSCLSDAAQAFFLQASNALSYMGTTLIFAEAPYQELRSLPTDLINFGFYTCYCFQWTLFENFAKRSVLGLADDNLLASDVAFRLRALERHTREFLRYVDSGRVFGHSPFATVVPVAGWAPQYENCTFADLDAIREQRNKFIHAVESASILPNTESQKERLYERSMWILRQFAGNIDHEIQCLRK